MDGRDWFLDDEGPGELSEAGDSESDKSDLD